MRKGLKHSVIILDAEQLKTNWQYLLADDT